MGPCSLYLLRFRKAASGPWGEVACMSDPVPHPGDAGLDVLEELVAELLVRMESDGAGALEAFCSEHPEKQAALRQRVGALEKLGLLEFKDGPAVAGESVPERIGPYLISKELGRGGQGVVYLAEEEALSRPVALKVFAPGLLANREARIRFRREAEAASRLAPQLR